MSQKELADLLVGAKRANDRAQAQREVFARTIITTVASEYGVPEAKLFQANAPHSLESSARMTAMYLCVEFTKLSQSDIARVFKCYHTCVLHAHRLVHKHWTAAKTIMAVRDALGVDSGTGKEKP